MSVYLLGDVAEKRQAAVLWDGGCKRTEHFRREVLPFIDHHVSVPAVPNVSLKFVEHTVSMSAENVPFVSIENVPLLRRGWVWD